MTQILAMETAKVREPLSAYFNVDVLINQAVALKRDVACLRCVVYQVRLGVMVAPIVGSTMLVGGSKYEQLDAAFDELSQSIASGVSPSSKLCLAPACFSDHLRAYSFGVSTRDTSDGPIPMAPTWAATSGGCGTYARKTTRDPGAPQSSPYPQFSVAAAGCRIEPAGMGFASSGAPTRVNYKLPEAASTMYITSTYGVYTLTDDGGDALNYRSPSSASQSNCYSACSPSSSDRAVVSTPPIEYVAADEYRGTEPYTEPSETDSAAYSAPNQQEMPVAYVVGYSSPERGDTAATGCPQSLPDDEAAYWGYESYWSSPDHPEVAAGCASQYLPSYDDQQHEGGFDGPFAGIAESEMPA